MRLNLTIIMLLAVQFTNVNDVKFGMFTEEEVATVFESSVVPAFLYADLRGFYSHIVEEEAEKIILVKVLS